ncbi:ABC transporter permease [candidate division KSB1 bacterium]|nr:ABC transporter permease [candidate division KSB1 bacterium]NIR68899.1 ABC transporter permease [candidate division KSB1 bacterium]NIS24024.1 ABC transporter permease [candidate division KSB1 bacterium]NIT73188.1 ABC transporter permease [candidate division KSB1 bacterium]NIU24674.1 ABC transporter permease [candidate division KSB1 bacterium]
MRLAHTLRYDMLFQFRHGFYYAYVFVTVSYVLGLLNIEPGLREPVTTLLLFSDTAPLGFLFIGAIILLERGQNTLEALFITPLRLYEFFISKVVSLMLISLLSALAIMLLAHGLFQHAFIFIAGFALSSCFYTLLGLIFSVQAKTVNDYFARTVGVGLFICLPVLGYLEIAKTPLFYLFPTQASIILIEIVFRDVSVLEIVYAFGTLIAWTVTAAIMAYRSFYKHLILKVGA